VVSRWEFLDRCDVSTSLLLIIAHSVINTKVPENETRLYAQSRRSVSVMLMSKLGL
jgi:hypothetical protein